MYLKQICAPWQFGWPRNYSGPARGGTAGATTLLSWRPPAWESVSYHCRVRPAPQHSTVERRDRALNLSPADGLSTAAASLNHRMGGGSMDISTVSPAVVTGIDDGIAAVQLPADAIPNLFIHRHEQTEIIDDDVHVPRDAAMVELPAASIVPRALPCRCPAGPKSWRCAILHSQFQISFHIPIRKKSIDECD